MQFANTSQELQSLLKANVDPSIYTWIQEKSQSIVDATSAKDLYMTYSLMAGKIKTESVSVREVKSKGLKDYLATQKADALQLARMYLLAKALEENAAYFKSKVANLIQVADTGELETFLKYLILLPDAENYKFTAVEALRTNIATVFEAISMKNPYPAKYFNDQQWNQMYLKAAFMQLDLSDILEVDERANKDLTRIISDYAHERWAASRTVDPLFWRPVSRFLNQNLIDDMKRLLESENPLENRAGALCCFYSETAEAKELLNEYPRLQEQVANKKISWSTIKDGI